PPAAGAPVQSVVVPGDPIPAAPSREEAPGEGFLSVQEIYERVSPSVVVVYNLNESGQVRTHGTGFFIDPWGMVATNYHVVEGAASLKIKTKSGSTIDVRGVAASDAENDIVILAATLSADAVQTLRMTPSLPKVGDKIVVIGTPYHPQLAQTITDGLVSAIRPVSGGKRLIQISAPISPGSSGSPVVNMKGDVVGIATRVHRQASHIGIAVPGEILSGLTPASPFPVAKLPVLYAGQSLSVEPAPQPGDGQRKLEQERQRALEQRVREEEERRKWREQRIGEAADLLDKARHNLSFDRHDLAFSQFDKALQIFRGIGETQGMAVCLEQMGGILYKKGRPDLAQEYLRQAASMRGRM
ncbi:MAG TPA: trypsin-like peptidase domain-containing protein, partial [Syntrophales bacterium]|nr:trypsin-like peptidase domain-containing protein [Syntrophales bacterium]HPK18894.1 trypsin-like peptidase domain-containing protein [Syntrophales bacterium]